MNTPEGERIVALIAKLGHVLPDVRIRAAKNLLLKFQTGLVDRILESSNVLKSFSDSFHDSINRFILPAILEPKNNSLDAIFFKLLFQLITHIGPNLSAVTTSKVAYDGVGERVSPLVDLLSQLHSNAAINESNRQIVKKAIDSLCSIPVRKKEEFTQIYHKENITNNIQSKVSKTIQKSIITYASKAPSREQQELPLSMRDGFTNIIKSPLTLTGWKFPKLELTESDIRYFFDLEVRLKLAKDNCQLALLQTFVDFPAPILLQRPILLEVVFHIAGSTVTSDFTGSLYHNITPAFTIHWLEMLFKKCIRSYKILLDGSLCSTLVNKVNQGNEEGDKNTLANRMARSFSAMKYPVVAAIPENNKQYGIDDQYTMATNTSDRHEAEADYDFTPHSYPNHPITRISLPGFAFAVITLSLEILRSRDVELSDNALSLCLTALPYLLEPSNSDFSDDSYTTLSCQHQQPYQRSVRLSAVDFGRLYYILNLLEQVLLATQLDLTSIQNTVNLLSTFDENNHSNKESLDVSNASIPLHGFALETTLLRVTFEILLRIPLTALLNATTTTATTTSNTTSENTKKERKGISELILPHKITAILYEFCATESLRSLFPTRLVNYLDSIIKVSNIGVYEAHSLAKEALISVRKLRRRGLLENILPIALLQDVKLVLCVLISLSYSSSLKIENNSLINTDGEVHSVSGNMLLEDEELEDPLVVITAATVWCGGRESIMNDKENSTAVSTGSEAAVPGGGNVTETTGLFSHLICCVKDSSRIICLRKLLALLQVDSNESNKVRLLRSLGYLGPNPTNTPDHSLVATLCNPDFIQRLLLTGCLNAEDVEDGMKVSTIMESNQKDNNYITLNETQSDLKVLSYELLEVLCRFAIFHVATLLVNTNENAEKWRRLFPLVKLVVWNLVPSSSTAATAEQYNSIRIFSDRLEDFVASNASDSKCNNIDILGRIRVFGLFHRNNEIRGQSALLLLHELGYDTTTWTATSVDPFRTSNSTTLNDQHDSEINYAIISDSVGAIRLEEWNHLDRHIPVNNSISKSKNKPKNTTNSEYYTTKNVTGSSFSHLDVHRIALIITGTDHSNNNNKGGMEERIRATAAKQLIDILQNDNLLLETEDANWCINFAISLLDIIKTETCSDSLAVMSAKLLYLLVSRVSDVRHAMRFYQTTDNAEGLDENDVIEAHSITKVPHIDINPLLGIILLPTLSTYSKSIHVRSLCAEILWVYALTSTTTWCIDESRKSHQPLKCDTNFPLLRWRRNNHSIGMKGPLLEIPLFLKAHCLLMRRQSYPVATGDYTTSSSPCSLPIVTLTLQLCDRYTNAYFNQHKNISSQYFQQAIRKEIENVKFRDLLSPNNYDNVDEPYNRIYKNIGNKLHKEIIKSKDHRELRSALLVVKCLLRNFSSLAAACLRNNFISSFDRLLQTSPTSTSDFVTLTIALPLLRLLVDEEVKSPHQILIVKSGERKLSFSEYLLSVICTTFRPLLEWNVISTSVSVLDGRDAVSSTALLHHTQSEILSLFVSLCGSSITSLTERQPSLGLSANILHTKIHAFIAIIPSSITLLLLKILCSESQPYWIRLQASVIIEKVVVSSEDIRNILTQPTASTQYMTFISDSQRTPLEDLCHLIRLFRIPDSLRGSALVISCLQIIIVCFQDNKLSFELPLIEKESTSGEEDTIDNKLLHIQQKWGWVTKLCHDRRGEIRILALQLLELLVEHTAHHLAVSTHTSNPMHENTNFDDSTPLTTATRTAWPPIHSLNQLVQDDLESPVVRCKAMEIIIKLSFNNILIQNKSTILFLYNTLPFHKKLYSTLTTLLQSIVLKNNHNKNYTQTNSFTLRNILNLFLLLLNNTLLVIIKINENYLQGLNPFSGDENEELITILIKEYFDSIKTNKILPLIIEILNPQIKQIFYYKSLLRIGQSQINSNNNYNDDNNTESNHQDYYDNNSGWNIANKDYFQMQIHQVEDSQRYVSQFLSMVFDADLRCRHPNFSNLLHDALQHSQIFPYLMELIQLRGLHLNTNNTSIYAKENNFENEGNSYLGFTASYIAHSELLSLILRQGYDVSSSSPPVVPSDSHMMPDKKSVLLTLLTGFQNNTTNNPMNIWNGFTQRLQLIYLFLRRHSVSTFSNDHPSTIITSCSEIVIFFKLNELRCTLRLIGLFLMIPEWIQILRNNFPSSNNRFTTSDSVISLLPVLSQFLINTEDFLHISNMDVYLSMIATTVGLLLEKIPEYRSILMHHEIPTDQKSDTPTNNNSRKIGMELLQSVLDKILTQDINWINILQHELTATKKKQSSLPVPLPTDQSIYSTTSMPSTTNSPPHYTPNTIIDTDVFISDKRISPVNQVSSKSLTTKKAFPETPSGKSPLSLLKGTTRSGRIPVVKNGSNHKKASELNNDHNNSNSSSTAATNRATKGKSDERKWRTKARSYIINESSNHHSSTAIDQTENILKVVEAGTNAVYSKPHENNSFKILPSLKGLWSSLLVLLSVLPENNSYIHYALSYQSNQLAALLCNILRTTITSLYLIRGPNNAYPSSTTMESLPNKRIGFSRGDDSYYLQSILFTSLSVLSVLSKDSDEVTKRMLITCTSSAQSKISLLDTDRSVSGSIQRKAKQNEVSFGAVDGVGNGGGPLAQLTAITLSPGSDVAVRWLCLAVVGNIVSGDVKMQSMLSEGLLGQKIIALGCILKNSIQKESLANASRITGFQMFLCTCLEVFTSCIVVEVSRHGAATLLHEEKNSAVESISFPDLMEWLWLHRSSGHPDVSLAIVKCLGIVAISAGAQAGVSKKFFVNIVNEKILLILLRAMDPRAYHPIVSYNACISLCNIFHNSEQARATAKAIIESPSTLLESLSLHQHDSQLSSLLSLAVNYLK